ncbi:MAG: formylglycine-generating enzyme family protein [Puniceicoccales bacterium]|nr:formylglycine-generating enzyme family protein [Puniceicoccales bacterium]
MRKTTQYPMHSGKTLKILLIVLACGTVMAASHFIASLETKPAPRAADPVKYRRETEDLQKKSQEMWERFLNVRSVKGHDNLDKEDIKMLESALTMREEYVLRTELKNDSKMLIEPMREQWQLLKARESRERSIAAEKAADAAYAGNDYATAARIYTTALEIEDEIGGRFGLGNLKDITRISSLNAKLRSSRAIPIRKEALELEEKADALVAKKSWQEAAEKYTEARKKWELLNSQYSSVTVLERTRTNQLDVKIATFRSTPEHERLQNRIGRARRLYEEGRAVLAAKEWDAALSGYADLSKLYPKSEHVAKATLTALRQDRDRTLSEQEINAFTSNLSATDQAIREAKVQDVANFTRILQQDADRLRQKYPSIILVNDETYAKLQYLRVKVEELLLIQNKFLPLLKPLPGADELRMLQSEVPQSLYSAVMGSNPSATPGEHLPVESLNYTEALLFCQRIGWLTGRIVRLPTQEEFRRALGTNAAAQLWTIENSGGNTHSVASGDPNENGFYDLLGNVAEWVSSDAAAAFAWEFGGHCQSARNTLANSLEQSVAKREKSRLRGIRVVAEAPKDSK